MLLKMLMWQELTQQEKENNETARQLIEGVWSIMWTKGGCLMIIVAFVLVAIAVVLFDKWRRPRWKNRLP